LGIQFTLTNIPLSKFGYSGDCQPKIIRQYLNCRSRTISIVPIQTTNTILCRTHNIYRHGENIFKAPKPSGFWEVFSFFLVRQSVRSISIESSQHNSQELTSKVRETPASKSSSSTSYQTDQDVDFGFSLNKAYPPHH